MKAKDVGWIMYSLTIMIPLMWIAVFIKDGVMMLPGIILLIFHTVLWWKFLYSEFFSKDEER